MEPMTVFYCLMVLGAFRSPLPDVMCSLRALHLYTKLSWPRGEQSVRRRTTLLTSSDNGDRRSLRSRTLITTLIRLNAREYVLYEGELINRSQMDVISFLCVISM
jgi:hypothetical protein